jgi:predicted HicB family RNase H-like nuclease
MNISPFAKRKAPPPNIPFKGSFNVRVSRDLHQRAAPYAEENDMKLNTVVQDALKEYLAHAE